MLFLLIFSLFLLIVFLIIFFLLKKNKSLQHSFSEFKKQEKSSGEKEKLSEEKKKLEEKNRKLFQMSETVYKEKKKVDEELEKIKIEKEKLEEEKKKFQDKNKKLWQQSVAIHKEKERIDILKREVDRKHKDVMDSINYAQRIQRALLTSETHFKKHLLEYFILFKPRDIVSGDFYWAYNNSENNVFLIATADCTGHGVPGAFMSMLGISFLNEIAIEKNLSQPDLILNHLRENIIRALNPVGAITEAKDGMDMSLCKWDFTKMELQFAAANNGIYLIRNGELSSFKADKFPVGKHAVALTPFNLQTIPLEKDDCIYTLTDGYPDQFGGPKGKKFKYKQFEELLLSVHLKPMEEQKIILNKTIDDWMKEVEQIDDICIIGVRV